MATAHHRGALLSEKFWFRRNLFPLRSPKTNGVTPSSTPDIKVQDGQGPIDGEYTLMTVNEIMNGHPDEFVGLIPLIESYLNSVNVDVMTRCELAGYLSLVSKRASGELQTGATWIRNYVRSHPDYRRDSVVSERVNYDLMRVIEKLGHGDMQNGLAMELLGY